MLVVQFALGIYVNLYVTVPSADHGHGFGQAIANGPAGLTLHIVLGLLLILAALGFLVQAILARQPALIAAAALGLLVNDRRGGLRQRLHRQWQGRRIDGDGTAGRRGAAVLRRQPVPAADGRRPGS